MDLCLSIFGFGGGAESDTFKAALLENVGKSIDNLIPSCSATIAAQIEILKGEGNAAFNQDKHENAIKSYTKGILLFKMEKPSDDQNSNSQYALMLLTALLSNRAASYIKLGEYEKGLLDARSITLYRPNWVKGHFRQGEAFFGLRMFDQALNAYLAAQAHDPNSDLIACRIFKTKIFIKDDQNGLEIHQITPGREICIFSYFTPIQSIIFETVAKPMKNLVYLICHKASRQAVVIDACWDINGILDYAREHKIDIIAAIATHYHVDHVGGLPPPPFDKYGVRIDGLSKLLQKLPDIVAYVHTEEMDQLVASNPKIDITRIFQTNHGFKLEIPTGPKIVASPIRSTHLNIEFLHTPGHTAGSQCILVNNSRLFSGDTLFIQSCGRVDFPDSCKSAMFNSLQDTLSKLNDDVVVFPGHSYGGDFTTIQNERHRGLLEKMSELEFLSRVS